MNFDHSTVRNLSMQMFTTSEDADGASISSIKPLARESNLSRNDPRILAISRWRALLLLVGLCVCCQSIRAATLTLTWDPSATATSYKLYGAEGTAAFSFNQQTSSTTLAVPVNTNVVTRFYVTALNSAGESGPSNTVTNQPGTAPPGPPILVLAAPTMASTNLIVGQTVTITAIISNAGESDLMLAGGALTLLAPGATIADGPYIQIIGLPAQTIHAKGSFSVSGPWLVDSQIGRWSAYMAVKNDANVWVAGPQTPFTVTTITPSQPPAAPTSLRVTPVTTTRLNLDWIGTPTASTEVERSKDTESFRRIVTVAPGTMRYTDNVLRHRDYRYRVRAKNGVGISDYSNVAEYAAP